jgi:chemotaxis signal transduction protein
LPEEEEPAPRRLLLVATAGGVASLPAEPVVEVIPARPYARLPGAAECIAGLVNRRGQLVTVVDLGIALGDEAVAGDPEHRIVIVAFRGMELGLAVSDVLRFTEVRGRESGEDASGGTGAEEGGSSGGGEDNLRVVDLESLLAPHFGGGGGRDGEPSSERP